MNYSYRLIYLFLLIRAHKASIYFIPRQDKYPKARINYFCNLKTFESSNNKNLNIE